MKSFLVKLNLRLTSLLFLFSVAAAQAGGYTNLSIAVYFRYQEIHSIPANLDHFSNQWANVEKQVHVDKVYLETTRNAQLATEADVTTLKKFFNDRGIKTSGGLGLTANEPNGFQSYCYSTPADREKVKAMSEFTARHFDEIILDDFFFSNCKCDRCIAAKGEKSWTRFRTEQLDDVSRDLIIGPAKAINPKCGSSSNTPIGTRASRAWVTIWRSSRSFTMPSTPALRRAMPIPANTSSLTRAISRPGISTTSSPAATRAAG